MADEAAEQAVTDLGSWRRQLARQYLFPSVRSLESPKALNWPP